MLPHIIMDCVVHDVIKAEFNFVGYGLKKRLRAAIANTEFGYGAMLFGYCVDKS